MPKYFRQWIKATKVVEACGKLHPSQARSQDLILGGAVVSTRSAIPRGLGCREGGVPPPPAQSAEALTFH